MFGFGIERGRCFIKNKNIRISINSSCNCQSLFFSSREPDSVFSNPCSKGPHPIKTSKGWLHLAHGVRGCAAGLRYVLYVYLTDLYEPDKLIAEPAGHILAPIGAERVGDVSNVLFTNGWIADDDGTVFLYYASCDTRMHVAVSSVDRLLDYCLNTAPDGYRSATSVQTLTTLIQKNLGNK